MQHVMVCRVFPTENSGLKSYLAHSMRCSGNGTIYKEEKCFFWTQIDTFPKNTWCIWCEYTCKNDGKKERSYKQSISCRIIDTCENSGQVAVVLDGPAHQDLGPGGHALPEEVETLELTES